MNAGPILHTMLVANAGSGKTHALTTRMVKLLALGVEPRKIAALTFTKKAAGEFLDAVFMRLAEAAEEPERLSALNVELNADGAVPPLHADGCRELLRKLSLQAGSLCMGTIDSFFARIARSFPLESGLPGEFSIIGPAELEMARTEALAASFRKSGSDAKAASHFLELVRKISRRQGERRVFLTLLQSVRNFHDQFLKDPALRWGDAGLIWGEAGCPILRAGTVKRACEALWVEIVKEHPRLSQEARDQWEANLALASNHKPGSTWSEELKEFIRKRLCNSSIDKKSGEEYLPTGSAVDGRVYLRGKVPQFRRELLESLLKPVYESLLERSAALRGFMGSFEASYHTLTRRRGRMTFSDVTDLLATQVGRLDWMASAGYRLDARIDHWLLDEFQDTSRIQWKVLCSFIDEVVQDSGGARSLLYVGDTKQAIYSWRGGDPELFFEILAKYNRGSEPRVHSRDLKVSFRSAPVIVETINKVFGKLQGFASDLGIPQKALAAWSRAWREHEPAGKNRSLKGLVRWDAVEEDEEEEYGSALELRVATILEEVRPWERGISCAVLARKNDQAAVIASLLQARGIPVSVEGKSNPCNDNPLGIVLLAAFRLVSSPEDSLSRGIIVSSPLWEVVKEEERFRARALETISFAGYEATARAWLGRISLTPFLQQRARNILAAAAEYDLGNRGAISEFTAFLENHMVQEPEAAGVVRVMTVHQSKGLTFDMTVVSGLDGKGGGSTDVLHLGGGEPPRWGCLLPPKDLAEPDGVMREALEEERAQEEYGKLCTAYVAMTRSRQALYLVTKKLGSNTVSKNFGRLLMLSLSPGSEVVACGDNYWFEEYPIQAEASKEARPVESTPLPACTAGTPHAISPSLLAQKASVSGNGRSFYPEAADLGTEIHEVLSRIEWNLDASDLRSCSPEASLLLEAFLRTPEAATLFTRPGADWEVWNERAFDVMVDGQWISGVFDRVHIRKDKGHVVAAQIFDYKTNRSKPEVIKAEYAAQMKQYRLAASRLLGIPIDRIASRTVPIRQTN